MAYGARLESALGASPRGFESPILRRNECDPSRVVFHFWGWGVRTRFDGAPSASQSGDFGDILRKLFSSHLVAQSPWLFVDPGCLQSLLLESHEHALFASNS